MKTAVRKELFSKRRILSNERRREATLKAFHTFQNLKGHILAFASFGDEINLWPLNEYLALHRRLILPKVEGDELKLYHVEDLDLLVRSEWGILEPDPAVCKAALHVDVALVPGLGFDRKRHRIGFGKGFYDRLLRKLDAITIGVGFKEQLVEELPIEPWDYSLDRLSLS